MAEKLRKTGLGTIETVPWGTHFCQFYQTKEDMLDILVPYFKAGLESGEFCMWVTSEPLSVEDAKEAMLKAMPDFEKHLKKGQIEIIPHDEWYLKGGTFDMNRVLSDWLVKLTEAKAKGYEGMRVTGNTAWLERNGWKGFTEYEEAINRTIGKHDMMAICTYSLNKCGASEVIDVVSNHQYAFVKQEGKWKSVESSEHKVADEEMEKRLREAELFNKVAIDRELKMVELKKKIEELESKLGQKK